MRLFSSVALFFVILSISAYSAPLQGEGCAASREKAVRFALADLSAQVEAQVSSELYTVKTVAGDDVREYTSYKVRVDTDLPLFAYTTEYVFGCATVRFDPNTAPNAYRHKLAELKSLINGLTTSRHEGEPEGAYLERLKKSLPIYDELQDTATVARFLNVQGKAPISAKGEIERIIATAGYISSDIPQIAANILSEITYKPLFIKPILHAGYMSEAHFGALLRRQLESKGANTPKVSYGLDCEYTPVYEADSFMISCRVLDQLNTVMQTVITRAGAGVCAEAACEPAPANAMLERLGGYFTNNTGLRGDFYSDLGYSNSGDTNLLLKDGDLLRLYARVNSAAEIVLLAVQPEQERAYLIPLGKDTPLFKLSKEQAGQETELIRLKATKPYGQEYLIMIAISGEAAKFLPAYTFNEKTGVYDVAGKAAEILPAMLKKLGNIPYFKAELLFNVESGL